MSSSSHLKKIPIKIATNSVSSARRWPWMLKVEEWFYKHKNQLIFVHITMFVFFMSMMIIPLFTKFPDVNANIWNNLRLLSTFLFWGLWFPLVFASVIFAGRIWCGVLCPMGAATEWANKIGFQRPIPAWLRWEGTPVLSFLLITILGQTLDVRDENSAMLEIFGGTLLLALIIGIFFGRNKRAWCRHACPIGLLLGVFSRLSVIEFAPKLPQKGGDRYAERGVCPTMIDINHKAESRHCIQCFRCVKPASPGGLFLRFRKAGEEILQIRHRNPNWAEIWFMFLATGVSLGGFLWLILPQYQTWRQQVGNWFINHGWYWIGNTGPSWLMSVHPEQHQAYNWLDFMMIIAFMLVCMLFCTFVLCATNALSSWLAGKFNGDRTFKSRFLESGYQFAPIAMISIIIGLGDQLFKQLQLSGLPADLISYFKISLFLLSIVWSIYLGYHILKNQGVTKIGRFLALIPSALGSIIIAAAWWPAIFGVHFSMLAEYRAHLAILS
ncbi:MAG: 4Fe-4S binding protein [Legionellales bacterium]|nr:4Fe-4S binding protein [Legionellales bacterium]